MPFNVAMAGPAWPGSGLVAPLSPFAEPGESPAVRSKHRYHKVRRTVGGARSGAQSAWDAGQRTAEAVRGKRVNGRQKAACGRSFPASTAAGRTFTNAAIDIPIATNTSKSNPKLTGAMEAIVPAGHPAVTVCTIWMLIACKKGSDS
jgi:hypothetical protein